MGFIGSWDGSENLGEVDIPVALGDISIPDLDDIQLQLPQVDIPDMTASMLPITQLDLGRTVLDKIAIQQTDLPAAGFTLSGLGLGSVNASGISVPATETAKATINRIAPAANISLPGAVLSNISIPSTHVGEIRSGGFDTTATASAHSVSANLGILDITLRIEPSVYLNVDRMTLTDVELAMLADQLELQNLTLPVSIDGVTVNQLDLDQLAINQITF